MPTFDPMLPLSAATAAFGEGLDALFVRATFRSPTAGRRAARASLASRIEAARRLYPEAARDGRLFPAPPAAVLTQRPVRDLPEGEVVDLTWPSVWRSLEPSHATLLGRCPENAICHGRWFRHWRPAPTLIALHGWGAGHYAIEEVAMRARWLYRQGLDVVLVNLPFHARRLPRGRWTPMFPSTNPIRANEGFAQATSDLRALVRALRDRGAPSVGVAGMSLGGFTSALLATVEPTLDFAVPMIAFPSVAELMWDHAFGTEALARAAEAGLARDAFIDAFAPTSPEARPPAIASDRVLVIAGQRDRVTPLRYSERLAAHFGGAHLAVFPGSHLVQHGRAAAFDTLVAFLRGRGVLPA